LAEPLADAIHLWIDAGVAKLVDATDLDNLSALWETEDAELLKFGGTSNVAIPSQARERGKV
jgi:hypothetical protein